MQTTRTRQKVAPLQDVSRCYVQRKKRLTKGLIFTRFSKKTFNRVIPYSVFNKPRHQQRGSADYRYIRTAGLSRLNLETPLNANARGTRDLEKYNSPVSRRSVSAHRLRKSRRHSSTSQSDHRACLVAWHNRSRFGPKHALVSLLLRFIVLL